MAAAAGSGPAVSGAGGGVAVVLAAGLLAVLAVVQVQVMPVVEGGSSPSPAASDGCPLEMLLLTVVVLAAVQLAVQVAVLAAVLAAGMLVVLAVVQVAGLAVVLLGTRPSPAASNG
ncbi:hypothetical protein NDU88_001943 [Pleurodeles waltl]|uniref:Uncharacterized protein n=1 Tax=Pleurodeles waltl TaxID=8319 RepID=A0AAV7T0M7_PLEWA|nr:hypothetical protein NDU88_001943 [Pleurodeles waltl]